MKDYFVGSLSKWTHRLKFHERKQKKGENIESFTSELRQIASSCEFTQTDDPLNEALLGQFIIGVQDNRIREKLLLQDDSKLTFSAALEMAKEYERVTHESTTLKTFTATDNAFQVRSHRPQRAQVQPKQTARKENIQKLLPLWFYNASCNIRARPRQG